VDVYRPRSSNLWGEQWDCPGNMVTAPELVAKKLLEDCNQFGGTSECLEARPRRSRPPDLIDGVEIAIHEQARMAPACRYDRSFRR
jgi:hypothetical protein